MNTFIIALCGREIFINEDLSLPQICQIDIEDNSRYIPVAIDSEDKYLAIRLSEEEAKSISSLQRSELRSLYNKMPQQQFKVHMLINIPQHCAVHLEIKYPKIEYRPTIRRNFQSFMTSSISAKTCPNDLCCVGL